MKLNRRSTLLMVFLILLLADSCGQNAPVPVTNPSSVETSLASTARALAKQTETALGYTPTPSPVPTQTLTPTPKVSLYGSSLTMREDQTALFVDYKAGIQLVIPAGWLPLRVNEPEYYDAFTHQVVLDNQAIWDHLTNIQDAEPDRFRLDAVDIREGHIPNGVISYINVIFEAGDMRSLEKWAQAEGNRRKPFVQFKRLSTSYPRTADGTRVLVIDQSWASGKSETVFYRGVFFSLPTGTVVLDFYTNNSFKDTVLPEFQEVVNSLTLLNP